MAPSVTRWHRAWVAWLRFEFYALAFGLVPCGFLLVFVGLYHLPFVLIPLGLGFEAAAPWCYRVAERVR